MSSRAAPIQRRPLESKKPASKFWGSDMRGDLPLSLPAAAAEKLVTLELARDTALDLSRASQSRINQLPIDADMRIRERLRTEHDRHAEKHRVLARICSACSQFAMENRNRSLEGAPAPDVMLKNGETLNDALEHTRAEIKSLRVRLAVVNGPPPKTALIAKLAGSLVDPGNPARSDPTGATAH
jgi:hypothetical protein